MSSSDLLRGGVIRPALLALVLVAGACDSAEERLSKHYERGVELAEAGEPTKAVLEFRNALRFDDTHIPSLMGMAGAFEELGDLGDAVKYLRKVVEIDPSHVEANVTLGQAMLLAGEPGDALDYIEAALRVEPENPDALGTRAAIALRQDRLEEALADAHAALAIDPNHVGAGTVLINDRLRAGDRWEAMGLINRFLESNPDNLPLNLIRLQVLEQDDPKGEPVKAQLEKLISLRPEQSAFHLALARYYESTGDKAKAVDTMRAYADVNKDDTEKVLRFIRYLADAEGRDTARAELEKRIEASESAEAAFPYHRAVAELDILAGDREAAKARFAALEDVPDARIALARLMLGDDEREAAKKEINAVLEKDETNVSALELRAALQLQDDKPDAAILTLRKALNEAPNNVALLRLAAIAHERIGDLQLAGENLAAAVRASDYETDLVMGYVKFLRSQDNQAAAEIVLEEATSRHPDNRRFLSARAESALEKGDWQAAQRAAKAMEELGDENARNAARRVSAEALRQQGRFEESIALLEKQMDSVTGSSAAMTQLVSSYVRAGRQDDAIAFLDGVIEKEPDNVDAMIVRARLHMVQDERDEALATLNRAIETDPKSVEAHESLVQALMASNRLDEAMEAAERGVETLPDAATFELRLAMAQVRERQGKYDEAIELYRSLYKTNPASIVVANNLASLLTDHRSDDQESVQQAVTIARRLARSDVPQFQDTYGWALHLQGQNEAALRSLLAAYEALPDNAWVNYHLGETYAALNQPEKAREHLEKARSLGGADFPKLGELEKTLSGLGG